MKNWIYFIIAWCLYTLVHEATHSFLALSMNEYGGIIWHWYGPEINYVTPLEDRAPEYKWTLVSGISSIITILIGYFLFSRKKWILGLDSSNIKGILYYTTIVFLLFDPVNLCLGTFLFSGDAPGVAFGVKIPVWVIQMIFGVILLFNRELIIRFMMHFGVRPKQILFKPLFFKFK